MAQCVRGQRRAEVRGAARSRGWETQAQATSRGPEAVLRIHPQARAGKIGPRQSRQIIHMRIRNQVLLKRPWLFPVFTVSGAFFGLLNRPQNLGPVAIASIFVGVVAVINVWFFVARRGKLSARSPPEPPATKYAAAAGIMPGMPAADISRRRFRPLAVDAPL